MFYRTEISAMGKTRKSRYKEQRLARLRRAELRHIALWNSESNDDLDVDPPNAKRLHASSSGVEFDLVDTVRVNQEDVPHTSDNYDLEISSGDVQLINDSGSWESDVAHHHNDGGGYGESPDPSNSDNFQSSDSEHDTMTYREKWAKLVVKHQLPRQCTSEILQLLREGGHTEMPKDPRTLISTPEAVNSIKKCGGEYKYIGIQPGLKNILKSNPRYANEVNTLKLTVNVDGMPLFKSTRGQLWPIMMKVDHFSPFIVAIFYGKAKPNNIDEYLDDFLQEIYLLQRNNMLFNGKVYQVTVIAFICDAPARSFMKCVKLHCGYYSCERCKIPGAYSRLKHMTYFPVQYIYNKRTDEEFANMEYQPNHQTAGIRTPLIAAGIGCVTAFPLDYMHLVCLGVVKRLLTFFSKGPRDHECKLSMRDLNIISGRLCALSGQLPREFARQPRSLDDLPRWKATEFRTFLLYTGSVVLRGVVTGNIYKLFMKLSVALSILLNDDDGARNHYMDLAEQCLGDFVRDCVDLFGETFVVYNLHCLSHLADDAQHFQCSLNKINAFPFENKLQAVKRYVRSAHNPLAQVWKRLSEIQTSAYQQEFKPLKTYISTNMEKDSVFYLDGSREFVMVKRHRRRDNKYDGYLLHIDSVEDFFQQPCPSRYLNIALVRNWRNQHLTLTMISREKLNRKVVIIPINDTDYLFIPMLHEIEVDHSH